jgi:hypothetical protein
MHEIMSQASAKREALDRALAGLSNYQAFFNLIKKQSL